MSTPWGESTLEVRDNATCDHCWEHGIRVVKVGSGHNGYDPCTAQLCARCLALALRKLGRQPDAETPPQQNPFDTGL